MDREQVYKRWMSQKMSNGEAVAGKGTINSCRKLSNENFDIFYNYVESIIGDKAFKNRRSVILKFLVYLNDEGVDLKNVSQKNIDRYFEYCKAEKNEKDTNINKRVSFLKSFLSYCGNIIPEKLDVGKFRINKAKMKVKNPMKALTIKQLEQCRELYRDNLEKLYIIEMLYETECTDDDLVELTYTSFDVIEQCFRHNGKKISVSHTLTNIIEKIKYSKVFSNKYHVMTLIEHMKEELQEIGIENIKPQDLKKTRKMMMYKCPECNKEYEAIVENWCAKQYRYDGKFWIVCRRCGEEE